MSGDAPVNTDAALGGGPDEVGSDAGRVLKIQAKLHLWASSDPDRRFGDLFNLVADPAFLMEAWVRVRGNKGARSAGRGRPDRLLRRVRTRHGSVSG